MKFFNLDLHIAVIGDIQQIFNQLGHEVTNWSLSAHAWVLGRQTDKVDVVNRDTWRGINQEMCDAFYTRYKDELDQYDAFIVTYPPCFAMLYERWNKPIICVAAIRYETPFSNDRLAWEHFNEFLRDKIDAGTLIPIANNKYDAAYAEYFTQRKWEVIPSLCDYTKAPYTGTEAESLYISKFKMPFAIPGLVSREERFRPGPFQRIAKKLGLSSHKTGYSWPELAAFRSAVIIPYNASVMSIFEMYACGIPMLFPSQDLVRELYEEHRQNGVFSELSYNQAAGLPSKSVIPCDALDPNNYEDASVMMRWIAMSDFYDSENLKHITYFDSFGEMAELLGSIDTVTIHRMMSGHHRTRTENVYAAWKRVLEELSLRCEGGSNQHRNNERLCTTS